MNTGKVKVEICGWLKSNGREVKGTDGKTMGFGLTRSQLENCGASKRDLERAVDAGMIGKCYVRLTTFSMEVFYYAFPDVPAERHEDAAKTEPLHEQHGLPKLVPNPQPEGVPSNGST